MSGVGVGAVVGPHAAMRKMATATGQRSTFMPPFSHIIAKMPSQNDCAKLASMPYLKYTPGQRVRINEAASELVPGYVGVVGHIGIGSINAPSFYQGEYFVSVHQETGAKVILRLPERCLDEAPPDFRL